MASSDSFLGNISSGVSGLRRLLTPSFSSTPVSTGTDRNIDNRDASSVNYTEPNHIIEKHLPLRDHSSGYSSTHITSPGDPNELCVHNTTRPVVDNMSNIGNTSGPNKGNLDFSCESPNAHTQEPLTYTCMNQSQRGQANPHSHSHGANSPYPHFSENQHTHNVFHNESVKGIIFVMTRH